MINNDRVDWAGVIGFEAMQDNLNFVIGHRDEEI